jgi:hypothetical protein
MMKIGAFCSPPVHVKKSTSILVNGARVTEKIDFYFFEKSAKTGKKSVITRKKLVYRYPDSVKL